MKILKVGGMMVVVLGLTLLSVGMVMRLPMFQTKAKYSTLELKKFKIEDLKKFDGTDPKLPIYLAYEGNVFDVTAGRKFYEPGGVYHFITGKDATTELNIAGGGIVKRKYLIVGRIVE